MAGVGSTNFERHFFEMNEFFRAGVGAVIEDGAGRVLMFERAGHPGSWQFPQGGMERGEDPLETVWRELAEETGLGTDHVTVRAELKEWLAYELPEDARSEKTGRGQVQRWFAFALASTLVDEPPIRLGGVGAPAEFAAWRWSTMKAAVEGAVAFRQPTYRRLAKWVQELESDRDLRA